MDSELREYLDQRFDSVDRRFESIDRRFDSVDGRVDAVYGRLDAADGRITEAMHQFLVTVEGFRHQMQILAEGVVMNAEALSRFRAEFIAEIHEIRRGR
jgi:hypothetical protein